MATPLTSKVPPREAAAQHPAKSAVETTTERAQPSEVSKAPRAAVACAACRARKIKCSGDHPICVTCRRSNHDCVYPPVKRRREPRKPYVRDSDGAESSSMGAKRRDLGQATINREWQAFPDTGATPRATFHNNSVVAVQAPANPTNFTSTPKPASTPNFAYLAEDPQTNGPLSGYSFSNESPRWQDKFGLAPSPSHPQMPPVSNSYSPEGLNFSIESVAPDTGTPLSGLWYKASNSPSNGLGHPQGDGKTKHRVPYFRFFGPTAIAPGYKKVICDVTAPPSPAHEAQALPGPIMTIGNVGVEAALDTHGDCPSVDVLKVLLPLFQQHFGYFFPSLHLSIDETGRLSREVPHCLLNVVSALASRYSPLFGLPNPTGELPAASAWATKAKSQVSQSLGFASPDTVLTLLMISWYEFGQDRDGGLWMYSGMALRMGQDLGLDTYSGEFDPSMSIGDPFAYQRHVDEQRLQCSLRMMDAIMAIGTGRSAMYQTPTTAVPAFPQISLSSGMSVADPLPYAARIFSLASDMTQILVSLDQSGMKARLERAQGQLNDFHTSLPVELQFETSTFQIYTSLGLGSIFVLLHLWVHTLVILAYQPSLVSKSEKVTDSSKEVAASSAKTILDIATFAELIDAKAIAQPWINYAVFTAACVFLSQCQLANPQAQIESQANMNAGVIHMAKTARANFQRIVTILDKLQSFWQGVRYIKSVLIQKSEGVDQLKLFEDDENAGVVDLPPELAALWTEVAGAGRNDMVGLSLTGTMDLPYYQDPGSG